jgi:hypothetical protein
MRDREPEESESEKGVERGNQGGRRKWKWKATDRS